MSSTAVQLPTCPACGSIPHTGGVLACPSVKSVEYHTDGTIKRIEKYA